MVRNGDNPELRLYEAFGETLRKTYKKNLRCISTETLMTTNLTMLISKRLGIPIKTIKDFTPCKRFDTRILCLIIAKQSSESPWDVVGVMNVDEFRLWVIEQTWARLK